MRTRTNLCFGNGLNEGADIVGQFLPAGNITVVYEDKDLAALAAKLLTKRGYRVELLHCGEKSNFAKSMFILGFGGEQTVRAVQQFSAEHNLRYGFFTTFITPELFQNDRNEGFAEFVYVDCDYYNVDEPAACAEVYAALFAVVADACALYYKDKNYPFADKGVEGLLKHAKLLLTGESDRDKFVGETLRTVKSLCEALRLRRISRLTATDMRVRLGGGVQNAVYSAFFLNFLLIMFTKWNFRDMLIPAEKPVIGCAESPICPYSERDLLLTKEDLRAVMKRARAFGLEKEKPDLKRLADAMKNAVQADKRSLFAEIYSRGIPEELAGYG